MIDKGIIKEYLSNNSTKVCEDKIYYPVFEMLDKIDFELIDAEKSSIRVGKQYPEQLSNSCMITLVSKNNTCCRLSVDLWGDLVNIWIGQGYGAEDCWIKTDKDLIEYKDFLNTIFYKEIHEKLTYNTKDEVIKWDYRTRYGDKETKLTTMSGFYFGKTQVVETLYQPWIK